MTTITMITRSIMRSLCSLSKKVLTMLSIRLVGWVLRLCNACYVYASPCQRLLDYLHMRSRLLQSVFAHKLGNYDSTDSSVMLSLPAMEYAWRLGLQLSVEQVHVKDSSSGDGGGTDQQIGLTLFRCGGLSSSSYRGSPVLLIPGLLQDADVFLGVDYSRNLVVQLVKNGYDVWICNDRSSKYCSTGNNVNGSSSSRSINNSSKRKSQAPLFNSMDTAVSDLGLVIAYIASKYEQRNHGSISTLSGGSYRTYRDDEDMYREAKISCVAFAEGSIQVLSCISQQRWLNDFVSLVVALSLPVKSNRPIIEDIVVTKINSIPFLDNDQLLSSLQIIRKTLHPSASNAIMAAVVRNILGWHISSNISPKRVTELMQGMYASIAQRVASSAEHLAVAARSSRWEGIHSMRRDLSGVSCPVAIFASNESSVGSQLRNCVLYETYPYYETLDYLWADDVTASVHTAVLDLLQQVTGAAH